MYMFYLMVGSRYDISLQEWKRKRSVIVNAATSKASHPPKTEEKCQKGLIMPCRCVDMFSSSIEGDMFKYLKTILS